MDSLLTVKNIMLLMVGILVIVIGYVLLAQGPVDNVLSITVAPFLLVISYCVLIPVAIILKDKEQKKVK